LLQSKSFEEELTWREYLHCLGKIINIDKKYFINMFTIQREIKWLKKKQDSQVNNFWEENQFLANKVDELIQETENHEENEAQVTMIIDLENAKGDIQYEVDILQRKLEEHVKKTKYLKKQLRAWEKNNCDLQVKDQGSIQ